MTTCQPPRSCPHQAMPTISHSRSFTSKSSTRRRSQKRKSKFYRTHANERECWPKMRLRSRRCRQFHRSSSSHKLCIWRRNSNIRTLTILWSLRAHRKYRVVEMAVTRLWISSMCSDVSSPMSCDNCHQLPCSRSSKRKFFKFFWTWTMIEHVQT